MPYPNYPALQHTAKSLLSRTTILWLLEKNYATAYLALISTKEIKEPLFNRLAHIEGIAFFIQIPLLLDTIIQTFPLMEHAFNTAPNHRKKIALVTMAIEIIHIMLEALMAFNNMIFTGIGYYNNIYNRPDFFITGRDDNYTLLRWLNDVKQHGIFSHTALRFTLLEAKIFTGLFFALFLLSEIVHYINVRNNAMQAPAEAVPPNTLVRWRETTDIATVVESEIALHSDSMSVRQRLARRASTGS